MKETRAALVIIGNEILSGRTLDKNTQYIGEKLAAHGVPLAEVRIVPDIEEKIIGTVNALCDEYDYVMTTGGIGPTHDDITAGCIAKALGAEFIRHEEAYQILEDYYGKEDLNEARATMADMPAGAKLLPNPVSGAPGFYLDNVFVMAGVPRIMQAMLNTVLDVIEGGAPVLSETLICDLMEGVVAEGLGAIQDRYGAVEIGSYPRFQDGKLSVSVVLRSTDRKELDQVTEEVEALIKERGGNLLEA